MQIKYPDAVRFACSTCGDCCRGLDILLTAGEREKLQELDWRGRDETLVGTTPAVRVPGPQKAKRYRLARRDDGACVYLGDRNQCRIHEHFGAAAKPLVCRLYPFSFYPIGASVGVDAAFSCRAVAFGLGPPAREQLREWSALVEQTVKTPPGRYRLRRDMPIDGDRVWQIEHDLLELLSVPELPLVDRIRCVLQYLRLATTGDPTTANAAALRQTMVRALPLQIDRMRVVEGMDDTQRAVFFLWLYVALNPASAQLHERSKRDVAHEAQRRASAAELFRRNEGQPWLNNRELSVTFAEIQAVPAESFTGPCEPVSTFLRAKIIGQRFFFAGDERLPLTDGVLRLMLSFPMLVWTAKALAAGRKALAVEDDDVRSALRLLDPSVGQIATARLAPQQRKAWEFVIADTEFIERATYDLLQRR